MSLQLEAQRTLEDLESVYAQALEDKDMDKASGIIDMLVSEGHTLEALTLYDRYGK